MIITCPHCQTKYQVTYEAIGSAGRKVQCAHCQQAWDQRPVQRETADPQDRAAFDAIVEDALDEAIETEEKTVAAEVTRRLAAEKEAEAERRLASVDAGKVDPAVIRKRQRAFSKRQSAIAADLPLGRLRRVMRVLGVVLLAGTVAGAYFGRVPIVERFPAMAGVYASVGLGVNIVGLQFDSVTTLQSLRNGREVLDVSAQIVGVNPTPAHVPAVVITLFDGQGAPIYEWSVTPGVHDLMAGERATFNTQLALPPGDAQRLRLSFAGYQNTSASSAGHEASASAPPEAGHATPAAHAAEPTQDHAAPAAEPEPTLSEHH